MRTNELPGELDYLNRGICYAAIKHSVWSDEMVSYYEVEKVLEIWQTRHSRRE